MADDIGRERRDEQQGAQDELTVMYLGYNGYLYFFLLHFQTFKIILILRYINTAFGSVNINL